jgi:pimeloyl-ACP methyl ester carboxylesterase
MDFKRLASGAAVGLGSVALSNRALRSSPEELDPPLGRPMGRYDWRGFEVAFTEAGDPEDPDLLLLHGVNAAASSHEFRYVVDALAEDHHVLAPDLPGFGHSDRPPLLYSGSLYVTFVRDFVRDLTDEPIVLASSLSGAYAAVAAAEADVGELFLVSPTATTIAGRRTWVRTLLRTPVVGEGLYNLLVSRPAIRYFLSDHGFADPGAVPDRWVEYDWRTAHQRGARFAPASFVGGFLDLDVDLGAALADLGVPVTIVWGREAETTSQEVGRELAEAADARLVVFDGADLLPHAEYPKEFVETFRTVR